MFGEEEGEILRILGSEASERERCCSAVRRIVMRLRIARSRKAVMTVSGRYLRDSWKPARHDPHQFLPRSK